MITTRIRNIFLTFVQSMFANDPWLTWTLNPETTKIVIGPSNFYNNPLVASLPSIILDRSEVTWGYHTIDQDFSTGNLLDTKEPQADILYGSVVFNVQAQLEGACERIADYLYLQLSARKHKDAFKKQGINRLYGARLGRTSIIKGPEKSELVSIPVSVTFAMQAGWTNITNAANMQIHSRIIENTNEENATMGITMPDYGQGKFIEGSHYSIINSGTQILFDPMPSGVELLIEYVGAATQTQYKETYDYTNGGNNPLTLTEPVEYWNYTLKGIIVYAETESIELYP
jgi:hypothetical protein